MNRKDRRAMRSSARPASDAVAHHIHQGDLALREADAPAAIDAYLRAIERAPARLAAHYGLCSALLLQGRFAEAIAHLTQVLALEPDDVEGLCLLANAHLAAGAPRPALDAARKAFARADTAPVRALLANCLHALPALPDDPAIRAILVRAMSDPWDRPLHLAGHAISLLKTDLAALIARDATDDLALEPLCANPLLGCLLENALVADVALERLLTAARATLLRAADDTAWSSDQLAFCCALARQCFINEYVLAQSPDEAARVERLQHDLAAPALPHQLALLACYRPLHTLPACEQLLAQTWPAPVTALLAQQIREPAAEARLAAALPQLTPIDDAVSLQVQQQYEESPYPRWVKPPPPSHPAPIDQFIALSFPYPDLPYRKLGSRDPLDILVAGCGTGQQLFDLAQRLANPRILAVDLSRTSLAFARRQVEAAGLANIEFGQADLLRLGALGRSFDLIDCGGVLHHLGDPLAGWSVLRSLLRPGGVMRISLYSELARHRVVVAHRYIAERGYGRTADEIRRFRQDIFALPAGHPLRPLAQAPDFFSTSDCRDLLFHVQEHRFSVPQIAAFLDTAGLDCLGFEADQRSLSRYDAQFPHDRARADLANWHVFEQANPTTFRGMYQFWVQARD
jgi:SAM-dependent methyltransferase